MLIDAHMHTNGISRCSQCTPAQVIDVCKNNRLDGIVLTNHCKPAYIDEKGYGNWIQRYLDEFHITRELGEKAGLKVFLGIEVSPSGLGTVEFLIYGITDEFLLNSPELFNLSQKELYELCQKNNALLYQAHPYRNGAVPQDPKFLDGVEINCHPIYETNERVRVTEFARSNGLKISCGSDYHGDTYKSYCGMIVPDDINNSVEFADYIREHEQCELVIHDIVPGVIW